MTCSAFNVDGTPVIVCGQHKIWPCKTCGEAGTLQCDWKIAKGWATYEAQSEGFTTTCDEYICERCSEQVGDDKHLCPTHAERWSTDPRNKARRAVIDDQTE